MLEPTSSTTGPSGHDPISSNPKSETTAFLGQLGSSSQDEASERHELVQRLSEIGSVAQRLSERVAALELLLSPKLVPTLVTSWYLANPAFLQSIPLNLDQLTIPPSDS